MTRGNPRSTEAHAVLARYAARKLSGISPAAARAGLHVGRFKEVVTHLKETLEVRAAICFIRSGWRLPAGWEEISIASFFLWTKPPRCRLPAREDRRARILDSALRWTDRPLCHCDFSAAAPQTELITETVNSISMDRFTGIHAVREA